MVTCKVIGDPNAIFLNKFNTLLPSKRFFASSGYCADNLSFRPKSSCSYSCCSICAGCGLENNSGITVQISVNSVTATEFCSDTLFKTVVLRLLPDRTSF